MWSADNLVAAYFTALEQLDSISAQRVSETVECCKWCGGPSSQRVGRLRRGLREWHLTCTDCGRPWAPADLELGWIFGKPPGLGFETKLHWLLDRLRPLRDLIEPRPRQLTRDQWKQRLQLWRLYLLAGPAKATTLIQEREQDSSWTRDRLEETIAACRRVIESRLHWQRNDLPRSTTTWH